MKGLKTLGAMLLSVALLTAATTATAGAAAFKHYVACGVSQNATPSHKCPKQAKKGAFFKSLQGVAGNTLKFTAGDHQGLHGDDIFVWAEVHGGKLEKADLSAFREKR